MIRNGTQRDERFDEMVRFRTEYGSRGLASLVGVFIQKAPAFDGDAELAHEIGLAMGTLTKALELIPVAGEFGPCRPYPRRCTSCGKDTVKAVSIAYDAEAKHTDGKLYKFHITKMDIDQCESCGEQYFTAETDDQITAGLKAAVASVTAK